MQAVQVRRHGGPEELVVADMADPVPGADQMVVRNRWIGVNYVDLQHREGRPYPVQLPLVPEVMAATLPSEAVREVNMAWASVNVRLAVA